MFWHRWRLTNLGQNRTSPRTWTSPGCRSSSSPSPSAAAPAERAAPSAASAGGPSAARPARPAPAASVRQERPAQTHADGRAMRRLSYLYVELGPPEQVERGVPHRVRRQGNLLLQLLQALPQLGPSTMQIWLLTRALIIPSEHRVK